MNVPVIRNGKIRYVLNAAFEPKVITDLLHESPQFSGIPAVILDRKGFIVGRSKDAEKFVGQRAAPHLVEETRKHDAGVGSGDTLQGTPLYYSYARSPITGWVASMGANRRELERAVRTGWVVGAALMLGGLVLGLLLALSIAARLRRAIVALANAASRNEPVRVGGLRTREIELLERAVVEAAQAREARVRREEAEAASEAKDRYIATLSHELRNPLAALNNAVYLLKLGDAKQPAIDMMQRQLAQLTRMVNDLLDVSRGAHGKVTLELADVDLREVIAQAIETAAGSFEQKRLRLTRELPSEPVLVRGDAARLLQVFSNLLDNAGKFTAEHGAIGVSLAARGRGSCRHRERHGRRDRGRIPAAAFRGLYPGRHHPRAPLERTRTRARPRAPDRRRARRAHQRRERRHGSGKPVYRAIAPRPIKGSDQFFKLV